VGLTVLTWWISSLSAVVERSGRDGECVRDYLSEVFKSVQAPTHVTLLIVELWEINGTQLDLVPPPSRPSLSTTTGATGLLDYNVCCLYYCMPSSIIPDLTHPAMRPIL
jgi:hypothetical protein